MKQLITLMIICLSTLMYGQTTLTIPQINTRVDTANCDDESIYNGDTVTFTGYVVTSGNLGELASGSTQGANGIRPFVFVNDTANGGAIGPWTGLQVMGVNWQTTTATAGMTTLLEGDIITVTGVIDYYNGAMQIAPLSNSSVSTGGVMASLPGPVNIPVSTLNGPNSIQHMNTGEPYEGTFVEINDVVVTNVTNSGSGATARVNFTVADASGNSITIYDKFLAQKLSSWTALNPNSPATNGSFTAPSVGTYFSSIKGVVDHYDATTNCTGGYQIDPFDASHYTVGESFPAITNVAHNPVVPTSIDPITITAEVEDLDGTLDSVRIYYSTSATMLPSNYPSASMSLVSGTTYQYNIPAQADGSIVYYYLRAVDNDTNASMYPSGTTNGEPNYSVIYVRDNGLSIYDVQKPIGNSTSSPFVNQEVTIRGFVTATKDTCDLGYLYIQDTAYTEYAGIYVTGSLLLSNLTRHQYVEVTGNIVENYGFTRIEVTSLNPGTSSYEVQPIVLDPSDSAAYSQFEKYESMLVTYENPNGKLYISEGDAGFGEYRVSTALGNTEEYNSRRIMAGRAVEGSYQSSLAVQLVSDSYYQGNDGEMLFTAIEADTTMEMDAVTGIVYYAFSNFKLTPRNNNDFEGINVSLDTACTNPTISIEEVVNLNNGVTIYPNPAQNIINIEHSNIDYVKASLYAVNGQLLTSQSVKGSEMMSMDLSAYQNGIYLLSLTDKNGQLIETKKVIIRK